MVQTPALPVIDMAPLRATDDPAACRRTAEAIDRACRASGFFYVRGHGIREASLQRLETASRRFFALPEKEKAEIAMAHGGAAWRGWFPLGGELTSGRPDRKEGLYFGSELGPDDARVRAGWPLHGANLWPRQIEELRPAVLDYMRQAVRAAAALMTGIALALDLDADYFERHYTADPTVLFRIFRYPAATDADPGWGVGEHTDYGLLTLLAQDAHGGLQVKTPAGWIDAPPMAGTIVCNIGDMLDRLTGGLYRSTPHRVRNAGGEDRLSFPLFFDPDFAAEIRPLPGRGGAPDPRTARWDGANLEDVSGTYGDYLLRKVGKVFPALGAAVRLGGFTRPG
jgi:isopenicillin N synthase-like dioxygenase